MKSWSCLDKVMTAPSVFGNYWRSSLRPLIYHVLLWPSWYESQCHITVQSGLETWCLKGIQYFEILQQSRTQSLDQAPRKSCISQVELLFERHGLTLIQPCDTSNFSKRSLCQKTSQRLAIFAGYAVEAGHCTNLCLTTIITYSSHILYHRPCLAGVTHSRDFLFHCVW